MLKALLDKVKNYTDTHPGQSPYMTPIETLALFRSDYPKNPEHRMMQPALCLVVQGEKWAELGGKRHYYKVGQALVVSIDIPTFGCVSEASPDEPYFGIILGLDPTIMREVIEQLPVDTQSKPDMGEGLFVTNIEKPLADCMLRMLNLLDTPDAIPVLYPAIMREICYWLLTSPHGNRVAKLTLTNPHTQKLTHAIHFLRKHFTEAILIDELASLANLSPSAFHRQFKAFTSISPLQYQKQLRLLEARRLISSGIETIEKAAFQVGYESPSQFSREYSRMFGHPPSKETNPTVLISPA